MSPIDAIDKKDYIWAVFKKIVSLESESTLQKLKMPISRLSGP